MQKSGFVNIIGDVTDSSKKLRNDPSGMNYFRLQEILTTAMNEKNEFPEEYRDLIVHALLSGMRVIEMVSMNYRQKNGLK